MTSASNPTERSERRRFWRRLLVVAVAGAGASLAGVLFAVGGANPRPDSALAPFVPEPAQVAVAGGRLLLAPNDWEAVGKFTPLQVDVATFRIDRYEVTVAEYATCRDCTSSTVDPPLDSPVTNVRIEDAERFCRSRGGRLPTHQQWLFAAASPLANRYPWGQTGLVCRKAVFGMANGPCDEGVDRPSRVGSRPLGATPSGVHDLCGNVAEWVTDRSKVYAAGGSFRSTLAGQLKVWAREEVSVPRDDIGFRCAYDD